ncbi:hypothetical protein ACQ4PT_002389 [Festuca glaucescens]
MDRAPANGESAPPPPAPTPQQAAPLRQLPPTVHPVSNPADLPHIPPPLNPILTTHRPLLLRYCGNHPPESSSASRRRVPCPVDPSHTVFQENLEAHVGKCPFRKHADALAAQPYYSKGVNSGGGEAGGGVVTSAAKRSSVHKLSEQEFWGLVAKIRSAHAAAAVQMRESHVAPDACDKWMKGQVDRTVPYEEKHVVQQVSIVGNMETFGLLPRGATGDAAAENALAVVEFGAGRGYLTQMLADCYGIKNIFLVERRSYKLKADRSLRQNEGVTLERLRIDNKAFLLGLGIAEEEFHAMTWFSSWAVDGDHSSQDSLEAEDSSSEVRIFIVTLAYF